MVFDLTYHEHGGSGLNLTYGDLMKMPLEQLTNFHQKLIDKRADEAAAIKRAFSKKR